MTGSEYQSPYVGPRPFQSDETDLFFGRTREIAELTALVLAYPAVLFYAQSGAGKSSLLNAGVRPALIAQAGYEVLEARPGLAAEPAPPTDAPNFNIYMYNTLAQCAGRLASPRELESMTLVDFLILKDRHTDERDLPKARVLIFDQFEELFKTYPERWLDRLDFFKQVGQALRSDPLLRVVFSMREDFIAALEPYVDLLPNHLRTRFRLELLKRNAALEAITQPLRYRTPAVWFDTGVEVRLVDDLLAIRAHDTGNFVPGPFVEPVYLQVVCHNLWLEVHKKRLTTITAEVLEEFGQVEQALSNFYEDCVKAVALAFRLEEDTVRWWIARNLITEDRKRNPVVRSDTGTPLDGLPNGALEQLVSLHLLRPEDQGEGVYRYELAHDRMIEPILRSNERAWRRSQQVELQRLRATLPVNAAGLTGEVLSSLFELLAPLTSTDAQRRTLTALALKDDPRLLQSLEYGGTSANFSANLVWTLLNYGDITPGKPSLVALLEIVAIQVPPDRHVAVQTLIDEIRSSIAPLTPPPPLPAPETPPQESGYVFISYAHRDSDFAERLKHDLLANGIRTWSDIELEPGTPVWKQTVQNRLETCSAVLLVASTAVRRSEWVQRELDYAQTLAKPIYPIWVAGEQWLEAVPLGMSRLKYIDARTSADYEQALEKLSFLLLGLQTGQAAPLAADVTLRNPYKGLRPFREQDSQDFFGRDELVNRLIADLREARFLVLVGASGIGKSSVAMAGLIPRLQAGALPNSRAWVYLPPVMPGEYPLENLAQALASCLPEDASVDATVQTLNDPDARGLIDLIQLVTGERQTQMVLLVDQFEELFTRTISKDERDQFISLLVAAANDFQCPVRIILTLRADFYSYAVEYRELAELFTAHTRVVSLMPPAELRAAILKPAALAGLTLDAELTERLIFDIKDQIGALPLLQFTLDQLFLYRQGSRLTLDAYERIGGLRGAIANHAEEVFKLLPSDEHRSLARALFLRLVESHEDQRATRRRVPLDELTLPDPVRTDILREVAGEFIRARLLVTSSVRGGTPTLEIAHEAIILAWPRLNAWFNEARADATLQKTISDSAARWIERNRPEDILYRGVILDEAERWAIRNLSSADENAFIEASRFSQNRRIARDRRRVWLLITASLVAIIVIVIASLTSVRAQSRISDAEKRANESQSLRLAVEARFLHPTNPDLAVALALEANSLDSPPLEAQAALAAVAYSPGTISLYGGYDSSIQAMALSPDRQTVVVGTYMGTIVVSDVATGDILSSWSSGLNLLRSVAYSPDGMTVASGGCLARSDKGVCTGGSVIIWDAQSGEERQRFEGNPAEVYRVAVSPDGQTLLAGGCAEKDSYDFCMRASLKLWNMQTGRMIWEFDTDAVNISDAAFNPDGSMVIAVGCAEELFYDCVRGSIDLWKVATGEAISYPHDDILAGVMSAAFSPAGDLLLIGTDEYESLIRLLDTSTGQEIWRLDGQTLGITSVAFNATGTQIVSGAGDKTVNWWDTETGALLYSFAGHTDIVTDAAFVLNDDRLLSSSSDQTMRLWRLTSGAEARRFAPLSGYITAVAFSPDGQRAVSSAVESEKAGLIVWDVATGDIVREFPDSRYATAAVFSPDSQQILAALDEGYTLSLWNVATGEQVHGPVEVGSVAKIVYCPDGSIFLLAGEDGVTVWNATTFEMKKPFQLDPEFWLSAAFSPDCQTVLANALSGQMVVGDAVTGDEINTLSSKGAGVLDVAFSPDGSRAVSGGDRLLIWDTASYTVIGELIGGHTLQVRSVAFSPDGRLLVSGADDGSVIVWDINSGVPIRRFEGHTGEIASVRFSPDGHYVLSGSTDGRLILWRVAALGELIAWTQANRYVRELDCGEQLAYGLSASCDLSISTQEPGD